VFLLDFAIIRQYRGLDCESETVGDCRSRISLRVLLTSPSPLLSREGKAREREGEREREKKTGGSEGVRE
jgi:hypothetical protein